MSRPTKNSNIITHALDALRELIRELEADSSLRELNRFRERSDALDRLDAYPLETTKLGNEPHEAGLYRRARSVRDTLEAGNKEFFETIREEIRRAAGAKALLPWTGLLSGTGHLRRGEPGDSYDYLDELVSGVLRFAAPGEHSVALANGMVAYQPTPARHIFDFLARTQLTERDVLLDLGSGLGHVPLLASICTNARCVGIEVEPSYVRCARQSAGELRLHHVSFVEQDAREADLSSGTVFYLYTPFRGMMLRAMLNSLRREAEERDIRVCTFGPCAATVAAEPWLEPVGAVEAGRVAVFRARAC